MSHIKKFLSHPLFYAFLGFLLLLIPRFVNPWIYRKFSAGNFSESIETSPDLVAWEKINAIIFLLVPLVIIFGVFFSFRRFARKSNTTPDWKALILYLFLFIFFGLVWYLPQFALRGFT